MTLPNDIQNGQPLDADLVMENFNDLDGRFPVTKANVSSVYASVIDWDSTVPASALGGLIGSGGGGSSSGIDTALLSDPMFLRMYGLNYVRRFPSVFWSLLETANTNRVAPIASGFIVFQPSSNQIIEVPRNSSGGAEDIYSLPRGYSFTAGDKPSHGVQVSPTEFYVVCDGTSFRGLKKITLNGTSTPTTVLDLTSSYELLGKCCVTKDGTYIFIAGKPTGGSALDTLVRVDISATTPSADAVQMTETGQDILDLFVCYNDVAGATSSGDVMLVQFDTGANGGRLSKVPVSQTGVYGGSIGAETVLKTYSGTEKVYGMVNWRGRCAVVTYDATSIKLYIEGYNYHVTAGQYTMWNSTATVSDDPLKGCVATDGDVIMTLLDSGALAMWRLGQTVPVFITPCSGVTVGAANYTDTSGLAYNGKTWVGSLNLTAAGNSVVFSF